MSDDTPTPTVLDCDRETARAWLATFYSIDDCLIDDEHKQTLAQACAKHRSAAERAGAEAERERILLRLRDKASIKRVVAKHEGEIAGAELSDEDRALKMAESYALTQAANELELLAPPDEPLTSDAVKAMLPAQYDMPDYKNGSYFGEYGRIEWMQGEDAGGFLLYINSTRRPLESLTRSAFARLVAAFGIEVPRG
jgi:hypothetical protein